MAGAMDARLDSHSNSRSSGSRAHGARRAPWDPDVEVKTRRRRDSDDLDALDESDELDEEEEGVFEDEDDALRLAQNAAKARVESRFTWLGPVGKVLDAVA